MEHTTLPFDAKTVALSGTNLIEASAGTGKTYSIAILALRLIIEENIPLQKILMVTFTKAAVAELLERVRLFIKLAYKCVQHNEINDPTIINLVETAIEKNGYEVIQQRLYDAVLLLDELSVITIHSFCQQTLTEFAFETRQLFGVEMFTELDEVIEQEVNHFWRKYITTLETELLEALSIDTLRSALKSVVRDHLEGKQYAPFNYKTTYSMDMISLDKLASFRFDLQQQSLQAEQNVLTAFEQYKEEIALVCNTSKARNKKDFIALLNDAKAFVSLLNSEKPNVLTKALPEGFLSIYDASKRAIEKAGAMSDHFLMEQLNCFAIQTVSAKVKSFLLRNNFLGYSDLIKNLHQALHKPLHKALTETANPALVAALQDKYKAVFVDEFQDTDKEQYEIFKTAFDTNTILFLIGDPKQSIYAWRKADIHTYFKARKDVDHIYEMDVNFRSSEPLITAMNKFFMPHEGFNTFAFPADEDGIEYTALKSPEKNTKGLLLYNGSPDIPISIFEAAKKDALIQDVTIQIQALLTDKAYQISVSGNTRPIKPSDIGVLVRRNSEAVGIKNYLAQIGIPAAMIHDAKILESQEAKQILYLLEAIYEPNLSSIHKALLNNITGFTMDDILQLDEEKVLAYFQQYKNIWQKNGVYPALQRFLKDFNLKKRLIGNHEIQGERILSNIIQLIELLNQSVHWGDLNQEELLSWLRRGVSGMDVSGDEFITRMENDEDAVKIVTIHKSKGLEYNIVLAPFLDMNADNKFEFQRYRDKNGNYLVRETALMNDEAISMNAAQLEQENRRLIYVAVTRAVFKCFIFENKAGYYNRSSLKPFTAAALNDGVHIYKGVMPAYHLSQYQTQQDLPVSNVLLADHFALVDDNWNKLSYSSMAVHPARVPKDRTDVWEDAYDKFVFNQLRFGAASGNLLHLILEKIDFSNDARWNQEIEHALKAYIPGRLEEFKPLLKQFLEHVVNVPIQIEGNTFSLKDINNERRIAELEFDFPIAGLQTKLLEQAAESHAATFIKAFDGATLGGLLNGKIDLFFEHDGRFYILDWKSNYLGFNRDDYNEAGVLNAMNENNYHLQYLIYTVALKKYLQSRIPNFNYDEQFGGVIYLFLRGLRKDNTGGVFSSRPQKEVIEKMEALLQKEVIKN